MNNDSLHLLNDYYKNVVQSIEGDQKGNNLYPQELRNGARVKLIGSIYVQSMAGKLNVEWIESFVEAEPSCSIPAIVASCNLADDTLDFESLFLKLRRLDKVRGISTVTSTSSIRSASPSTPAFAAEFERGFAMLESHGLSLDWKGAPAQLPAAAELFGRYPNIPVAIHHLGRPSEILGPDNGSMMPDSDKLNEWREGMSQMADLPHVCVKLSGLGGIIPGWTQSARRVDIIRRMCQETVELFGVERCMVATSWCKDAASADSGGLSDVGVDTTAAEYVEYMLDFFSGLTDVEQQRLFAGTAKAFYKI